MIIGRGFRWVRRIGLAVLSLVVLAPLYVIVTTALEPLSDAQSAFRWIPRRVTLGAFRDMWTTLPLGEYLRNSAIVAGCSAVLAVAIAAPAAYALARLRFRGERAFALTVLGTQFVPGLLFLLPVFLVYAQLQDVTGIHLIGSYTGLVLIDLTFALPFSIWLLAGYFATLPVDIERAAVLDGAGPIVVLVRIVAPLAAPGIAATAVFAFTLAWSEVMFASVLTDDRTRTVGAGLPGYAGQSSAYWNQLMAAALVSSLPVLIVFIGLRRFARAEVNAV